MPRSRYLTNEEHDTKEKARAALVAKTQAMDVLRKHPLARNAQTPSEVFQYLISILTAKPVMKVYARPTLNFKDQREANAVDISATEKDIENIINYSELLIVRLAMLIHTEIMVTAEIGREVTATDTAKRIKINLYGSSLIESERFAECLSELFDVNQIQKAIHTVFVDLASHQHPITQDPLSELLKSMATTRIHGEAHAKPIKSTKTLCFDSTIAIQSKTDQRVLTLFVGQLLKSMAATRIHGEAHAKPIKSNRTLCFDDTIAIQSITDQMVLTLFVGHLLTEICLVLLPTAWIAIKLYESHIDFIISSKHEAGISFVPTYDENTAYHHVEYTCFDSRDQPTKAGVIGVAANGMFDVEKLSMILAQHNQCPRVDITSWHALKDKAAYDTIHA